MADPNFTRRTTLAGLLASAASLPVGIVAPGHAWADAPSLATAADGDLAIDFDSALRSRLSWRRQPLTDMESGDGVRLAGGKLIDRFLMLDHRSEPLTGGKRFSLRGVSDAQLEKQVDLSFRDDRPGAMIIGNI